MNNFIAWMSGDEQTKRQVVASSAYVASNIFARHIERERKIFIASPVQSAPTMLVTVQDASGKQIEYEVEEGIVKDWQRTMVFWLIKFRRFARKLGS